MAFGSLGQNQIWGFVDERTNGRKSDLIDGIGIIQHFGHLVEVVEGKVGRVDLGHGEDVLLVDEGELRLVLLDCPGDSFYTSYTVLHCTALHCETLYTIDNILHKLVTKNLLPTVRPRVDRISSPGPVSPQACRVVASHWLRAQ